MEFIEFVQVNLLILVPLLWTIGLFFKKRPAFTAEWLIPIILWALGIAVTTLYLAIELGQGFSDTSLLNGFIQGTFIAAAAVFGNEVIKQLSVKRKE